MTAKDGDMPMSAVLPTVATSTSIAVSASDACAADSAEGSRQPVSTRIAPAIDGYEIVSQLGAGGMGTVWRAVQLSTRREVAIKVMGMGAFGSDRAQKRFDREVELTAQLEHANIARVYDSGLRQGLYFYAMELIHGVPLNQYVRARFSPDIGNDARRSGILALVRQVCLAVNHAHQRGVIHRDLKPSNILVDADGQPHVLDFGLAAPLLNQGKMGPDAMAMTLDGQITGTPAFMSPEQASGNQVAIDVRTDVYSIGVMLYHALVGRFPHDLTGTYLDILRRVSQEEVLRPRRAVPDLDGELEAILLKALARDPEARYASASVFAQDIANYLSGEPLVARPATTAYFLRKRLAKHRLPVAAGAGMLAALLGVAVFAYVRIARERTNAVIAGKNADRSADLARQQRKAALASEAKALANAKKALQEQARADAQYRAAEMELASSLIAQGNALGAADRWAESIELFERSQDVLKKLELSTTAADLGVWDAYRNAPPPLLTAQSHNTFLTGAALSPDGRTAVSMSWDGEVRVFDVVTGRALRAFQHGQRSAYAFALSADGQRLLTGSDDGALRLWATSDGRELRTLSQAKPAISRAAFSPDGRQAVTVGDGTLRLWDLETGQVLRTFEGRVARNCTAFSPDGRRILAAAPESGPGALALWDVAAGGILQTFGAHSSPVTACAFSPDGQRIAGGGEKGEISVWEVESGRNACKIPGQGLLVRKLLFSPDGRTLIASGNDPAISQWDIESGQRVRTIARVGRVFDLSLSTEADTLLAACSDGKVRLWSLLDGPEAGTLSGHKGRIRDLACSPEGLTALSAGDDGTLRQWDLATGLPLRVLARLPGSIVNAVRFLPDGKRALSIAGERTLTLWDLQSGQAIYSRETGKSCWYLAASADGRRCVCSGPQAVQFWDVDEGRLTQSADDPASLANVHAVALTPDARMTLTAGNDWYVRAWSAATGKRTEWPRLEGQVWGIDVSPDGKLAVSSSSILTLWDAASASLLRTVRGFTGDPHPVRFSPDGRLVLCGTADGFVHLFAVDNGDAMRVWRGHRGRIVAVDFSRDGRAALSAGDDQVVRVWNFSSADACRELQPRSVAAQHVLQTNPDDPAALATLGEWYAFRGMWARGADLLQRARAGGATVSSLSLARCCWKIGRLEDAAKEFKAAADAREVPESYAALCLAAVQNTRPARPPSTTR